MFVYVSMSVHIVPFGFFHDTEKYDITVILEGG